MIFLWKWNTTTQTLGSVNGFFSFFPLKVKPRHFTFILHYFLSWKYCLLFHVYDCCIYIQVHFRLDFLMEANSNVVRFDSLHPINYLSVIKGQVFLGWTSTKLGLMFFLKDTTQWCRWGCNLWPLGLESSTLPLHSLKQTVMNPDQMAPYDKQNLTLVLEY